MAEAINFIFLQWEQVGAIELRYPRGGHEHHQNIFSEFMKILIISTHVIFGLIIQLFALFHKAAYRDFFKLKTVLIALCDHYLIAQSSVFGRVDDSAGSQISLLKLAAIQG